MIPDVYLETVLDIWTNRRERRTWSISGDSMAPLIRHGDSLVIDHGNHNIRVGDVVVFKTPAKILAHRVIHKNSKGEGEVLLLKGDNCSTFDQLITKDHILGKVIEVRGSNGHLHFDSVSWRFLNYLLSILSCISGKRLRSDSALWKGASHLFVLSSRILPRRFSIRLVLLRTLLKTRKIMVHIQTLGSRQERRNV